MAKEPAVVKKTQEIDKQLEELDLGQVLDQKVKEAQGNEQEQLEWIVMKCIHTKDFDTLYKEFGLDKLKVLQEVEMTTGKK